MVVILSQQPVGNSTKIYMAELDSHAFRLQKNKGLNSTKIAIPSILYKNVLKFSRDKICLPTIYFNQPYLKVPPAQQDSTWPLTLLSKPPARKLRHCRSCSFNIGPEKQQLGSVDEFNCWFLADESFFDCLNLHLEDEVGILDKFLAILAGFWLDFWQILQFSDQTSDILTLFTQIFGEIFPIFSKFSARFFRPTFPTSPGGPGLSSQKLTIQWPAAMLKSIWSNGIATGWWYDEGLTNNLSVRAYTYICIYIYNVHVYVYIYIHIKDGVEPTYSFRKLILFWYVQPHFWWAQLGASRARPKSGLVFPGEAED